MIMRGTCDECARRKNCKILGGVLFGYCNGYFVQATATDKNATGTTGAKNRNHKEQTK